MKVIRHPYRTDFYMWHGVSAFFFSSCVTNIHSHNTMQIFVDLQGSFKCKIGDGEWKNYASLVIRENVIHQLDTNGSIQLLIYLDKETTAAKHIKARYMGQEDVYVPEINIPKDIDPKVLQHALLEPSPEQLLTIVNRVLEILCETKIGQTDERISKARQLIAEGDPSSLSVNNIASTVCLSESRFRDLFKKETGISVYNYILWSRIRFAITSIINGCAVNEAALGAGFTDSSHFHKVMTRMFGLSPSAFIKNNQNFKIHICDSVPLHFETNVYNRHGELEKVYH
jgi:AraC-like DNA-binding protein